MIARRLYLPAASLALLVTACFETMTAGGSGTGTGNSVTAAFTFGDGTPAGHVPVRVREADYLTPPQRPDAKDTGTFSIDGETDGDGVFRIDTIPAGSYVMESKDTRVGAVWRFAIKAKEKQRHSETLKPLGQLSGKVDAQGEISGPAYIQVAGMERLVPIDPATGEFSIKDLPAGEYALHSSLAPKDSGIVGGWKATVFSGEITTTPPLVLRRAYPGWGYSATLTLNTGATGAAIPGDVVGFPLLVKLDGANFPFPQARSDGADLRFAKPDGTPLDYEIERWNRDSLKAEIWVAMDTVYGNRETQTLRMFWGNPLAVSKSAGGAVFDTVKGFQAVWHMREEGPGTSRKDFYQDATLHGYHGIDSINAAGKEGLIGPGQEFDGVSDQIHIPHFVTSLCKSAYSISLWFKISGPGGTLLGQYDSDGKWSEGESALYFGDGTWIAPGDGGGQCSDGNVAPGRCVNGLYPSFVGFNRGYSIADSPVEANAWHHLTMTWDGAASTGKFYLDGASVGLAMNSLMNGPDSSDFDLYLGRPNGLESVAFFKGWMDEVRFVNTVRNEDWIRLSFESQRQGSKLIRISRP